MKKSNLSIDSIRAYFSPALVGQTSVCDGQTPARDEQMLAASFWFGWRV